MFWMASCDGGCVHGLRGVAIAEKYLSVWWDIGIEAATAVKAAGVAEAEFAVVFVWVRKTGAQCCTSAVVQPQGNEATRERTCSCEEVAEAAEAGDCAAAGTAVVGGAGANDAARVDGTVTETDGAGGCIAWFSAAPEHAGRPQLLRRASREDTESLFYTLSTWSADAIRHC